MLPDGVSVKGISHKENQDSFACAELDGGFVMALSDGLGSLKDSKFGSDALCCSVVDTALSLDEHLAVTSAEEFISIVHYEWLKKLSGRDVSQCCATMLFLIFYKGRLLAARIGDGFIGVLSENFDEVLFDAKEDLYVNETDCMTEILSLSRAEILDVKVAEIKGALLCSDGVYLGDISKEKLLCFTNEFVEGYTGMSRSEIKLHIFEWLKDWPGSDDKTLAFFIPDPGA